MNTCSNCEAMADKRDGMIRQVEDQQDTICRQVHIITDQKLEIAKLNNLINANTKKMKETKTALEDILISHTGNNSSIFRVIRSPFS